MNRNLVLTDGARVDSVPNLEIETGEIVGAGHASATGRFDDEQLFYLMGAWHPRDRRPPPGGPRLLRRAGPADRCPGHRGASAHQDRRVSWRRRSDDLRTRLVERASWRRTPPSGWNSTARRSPSCGPRASCSRSTTSARTRTSPRRGRGRRLPHRVLAARLALRPPFRQARQSSGDAPRPRIPRKDRRGRRARLPSPRSPEAPMATLEIRDLHVTVEADNATKEILKGVDLTVKQGETHAISGPERLRQVDPRLLPRGSPQVHDHRRHRHPRRRGRPEMSVDERARAGLVPRDAVPGRGPRRLGLQLPAHLRHRRPRR